MIDADLDASEQLIAVARDQQTSGIGFTEVMSGFIHIGEDVDDFELATKIARSECEAARFFLSVKTWNTQDCESTTSTCLNTANFQKWSLVVLILRC
jgi:hypothetical protein